MKIAILDDYQNVALSIADWSAVAKKADIIVFNDHIDQADALIERLLPFDVICVMREHAEPEKCCAGDRFWRHSP